MKPSILALSIALSLGSLPALAASTALSDLAAFSEQCVVEDTAKANSLREMGMTLGSNLGFAERAATIHKESSGMIINLSRAVNFSRFIDRDGWMPPVIEYVSSSFSTDGQRAEMTGESYRIIAPARFVLAPPTISDYLFTGLPVEPAPMDPLPLSLKPKSDAERKIWADAVYRGFGEGVKAADAVLEENVRRLKREYLGMMFYHKLLEKGMITRPMVASAKQDATITPLSIIKVPEQKEFAVPSGFSGVDKWQRDGFTEKPTEGAR